MSGLIVSHARADDPPKLKKMTWKVGDVTREALVYAPTSPEKKRPLIFAFHGHGGRAEYAARKFAFHQHWPEAVCVYPQGLPTAVPVLDPAGKMPGWQKFVGDQKDRDLEFFDAMLKTMTADYMIEEKRVYSAGHSNGGFFTYVLCAAWGDTFAAVAPVAAAVSVRDFKNQKPLPVLHVAGEKDRIVNFAGQERTIEQVRKLNGCDAQGKPAGKLCTEYSSRTGPPVVTYIHPGGHEIPDGAPERIVQFFKEQVRK
ncbi:esterase [Fimbriiglobus ruber]|uniref:Esterase n=1 Tax=Fimbriiglobus ruber TaxID=1908690 RepID=A0A225EB88_9BACT|nr:esterase [Fimbriiglobus ruber]